MLYLDRCILSNSNDQVLITDFVSTNSTSGLTSLGISDNEKTQRATATDVQSTPEKQRDRYVGSSNGRHRFDIAFSFPGKKNLSVKSTGELLLCFQVNGAIELVRLLNYCVH